MAVEACQMPLHFVVERLKRSSIATSGEDVVLSGRFGALGYVVPASAVGVDETR